ncbi:MAG TPA: hypothetical protein VD994_12085 [Prosthecobacter sp.]|nr:hypothetical protein [Prosthecobacter sp.]
MWLEPEELREVEAIQVCITEELADGTRVVSTFNSLEEIPEQLAAAFGASQTREGNGLDLVYLVRKALEEARKLEPPMDAEALPV